MGERLVGGRRRHCQIARALVLRSGEGSLHPSQDRVHPHRDHMCVVPTLCHSSPLHIPPLPRLALPFLLSYVFFFVLSHVLFFISRACHILHTEKQTMACRLMPADAAIWYC